MNESSVWNQMASPWPIKSVKTTVAVNLENEFKNLVQKLWPYKSNEEQTKKKHFSSLKFEFSPVSVLSSTTSFKEESMKSC